MITAAEVRDILNQIMDPCSVTAGVPAGLCDLGLVSDVTVTGTEQDQRVRVTVGTTEPGCLMIGSFATEARERLLGRPGVTAVDLTLDEGFHWTEDHMTPAYRTRLAERRGAAGRRLLPLVRSDVGG